MKGIVILLCEIQTSGNRTTTPGPTEATDVVLRRLNVEAGARPRVGDRSRPTTPSAGPTYFSTLCFSAFLLYYFLLLLLQAHLSAGLLYSYAFLLFYFSTFIPFCFFTFLCFYFSAFLLLFYLILNLVVQIQLFNCYALYCTT